MILSVDEITLALFGNEAGEKLDDYVCRAENYLYNKSIEIIETGTNVILDWGFWTKSERELARDFYNSHGIENEFHYINITDDEWHRRIKKRNSDISAGRLNAYYVDSGLAEKFGRIFEPPDSTEIDVLT